MVLQLSAIMCNGVNPSLLTHATYLFALSPWFNKSALMAPVKAASAKLFRICLAGFGFPASLTEYKVSRKKNTVWQQAQWGICCLLVYKCVNVFLITFLRERAA